MPNLRRYDWRCRVHHQLGGCFLPHVSTCLPEYVNPVCLIQYSDLRAPRGPRITSLGTSHSPVLGALTVCEVRC